MVDGAQKMSKVYNDLMKAGKWTAAQNKAEGTELVDSVGEIVALCEKEGFIPRYYVDAPQDKVDRTIQDMQKFTEDLISQETNLNNLIENAVKTMQKEEQDRLDAAEIAERENIDEDDMLFDYEKPVMTEDDFIEFKEFEDQLDEDNLKVYRELLENDDEENEQDVNNNGVK